MTNIWHKISSKGFQRLHGREPVWVQVGTLVGTLPPGGDIEGSRRGRKIVSWMARVESSQVKWVLAEPLQNSTHKSVLRMIFLEAFNFNLHVEFWEIF